MTFTEKLKVSSCHFNVFFRVIGKSVMEGHIPITIPVSNVQRLLGNCLFTDIKLNCKGNRLFANSDSNSAFTVTTRSSLIGTEGYVVSFLRLLGNETFDRNEGIVGSVRRFSNRMTGCDLPIISCKRSVVKIVCVSVYANFLLSVSRNRYTVKTFGSNRDRLTYRDVAYSYLNGACLLFQKRKRRVLLAVGNVCVRKEPHVLTENSVIHSTHSLVKMYE